MSGVWEFLLTLPFSAPDAFQDDRSQQHEVSTQNSSSHRQNAILPAPVAKVSSKPLFWRPSTSFLAIQLPDTNSEVQSLRAVVALIECLGNLVQSTSFHQEKYGRLMISVVVQYYQKCHERFKG